MNPALGLVAVFVAIAVALYVAVREWEAEAESARRNVEALESRRAAWRAECAEGERQRKENIRRGP